MKVTGISKVLHDHYRKTFLEHGATSKGVDWGDKEWAARLRQEMMLKVVKPDTARASIFDVGCGYGALADTIKEMNLPLVYVGIDLVGEMISEAKYRHPEHEFIHGDILATSVACQDYVVCNGILTQKVSASTLEMNKFAQQLIKRMFELCKIGVAFNLMTTHVNFQRENLYYRNPAEMLGWCMSEITPHVRIDCAYDLWYEYTVYLYKQDTEKS